MRVTRFTVNQTASDNVWWHRLLRLSTAVLVAAIASTMLAGCAGNDEEENRALQDVTKAYETAQRSMQNQNYRRAIQIYEILQARFPFSDLSKQIQLELMYAYYKSGRQDQAIDAADQFMRENPTHARVDYALYIKGLAYFERDPGLLERWFNKDVDKRPPRDGALSFSHLKRLVERYPASPYAEDARQRMVFLKNRLAAYENAVARFYLDRGAYVAALNRAKGALEEYNGATSGRDSLEIMIEAYQQMGMHDLAEDARRVLASNFPDERVAANP
jgi:outer membrane protein assembly factor BamD